MIKVEFKITMYRTVIEDIDVVSFYDTPAVMHRDRCWWRHFKFFNTINEFLTDKGIDYA